VHSVQYFALGLLKRLLHASKSLSLSLKNFQNEPELDFSMGLILRAILLDTLIGLNFYKLLKDNLEKGITSEEMKASTLNFCDRILADGLDNTAAYLQTATSLGLYTETDLKKAFNTFAKSYSDYFEPHQGDGIKPKSKYPKAPGPSDLFKTIAVDLDMKTISRIYDLYLYYSKYDHFGILYFEVQKETLSEKIKRRNKCINLFVRHCTILFDILERVSQKDPFVAKEYELVNNYLLANREI